MFLMELESLSHDNHTSLLDVVTECFSKVVALLRSKGLFCSSPCYLLTKLSGLNLAYFGCHVLALHVEKSLEIAIFLGVWHGDELIERWAEIPLAKCEYICDRCDTTFKKNTKQQTQSWSRIQYFPDPLSFGIGCSAASKLLDESKGITVAFSKNLGDIEKGGSLVAMCFKVSVSEGIKWRRGIFKGALRVWVGHDDTTQSSGMEPDFHRGCC